MAIRFLARRRRFEAEVRAYLRRRKLAPAQIDEALARLGELGLVSDAETSRAWIRDRLNFAPRGRALLRAELMAKGASQAAVEEALDELLPPEREVEAAVDALERRAPGFREREPGAARRRMWSVLGRRGFDPETAREAIARFFAKRSA